MRQHRADWGEQAAAVFVVSNGAASVLVSIAAGEAGTQARK
jgi:hypothetical protein